MFCRFLLRMIPRQTSLQSYIFLMCRILLHVRPVFEVAQMCINSFIFTIVSALIHGDLPSFLFLKELCFWILVVMIHFYKSKFVSFLPTKMFSKFSHRPFYFLNNLGATFSPFLSLLPVFCPSRLYVLFVFFISMLNILSWSH